MNEAEFQRNLTRFKAVLKREKRYLIKNDGEKVTETVSQKEKFIPIFENYDGPVSDKTKAMIDEIQESSNCFSKDIDGCDSSQSETAKRNVFEVQSDAKGKFGVSG